MTTPIVPIRRDRSVRSAGDGAVFPVSTPAPRAPPTRNVQVGPAHDPASRPSRTACADDSMTGVYCDDPDADGVGECRSGPTDQTCSLASGHPQRGCTNDANCGGALGSCGVQPSQVLPDRRRQFPTGRLLLRHRHAHRDRHGRPADGGRVEPDARRGLLRRSDGAAAVNNVAGLPGPARVTIRGRRPVIRS